MSAVDTLMLALETGEFPLDGRILFIGAEAHPFLRKIGGSLNLWQPFLPRSQMLGAHSGEILEKLPHDRLFNLVLVNIPKQADEAKAWIAEGLSRLEDGGFIIAAAPNDANGARLEKWFIETWLAPTSLSKNKARAVYARNAGTSPEIIREWKDKSSVRAVSFGDQYEYQTQPGLFSWDRLDKGTELLLQHLPLNIEGTGADFGCGIGCLSRNALKRWENIKSWHLLEADSRALACARLNLEGEKAILHYHQTDLTKPVFDLPPLDIILMNPPFHEGKKTDSDIGQGFIKTAAHHLNKNGRLLMVANTHLPYENLMNGLFSKSAKIAQDGGFKIIEAVK